MRHDPLAAVEELAMEDGSPVAAAVARLVALGLGRPSAQELVDRAVLKLPAWADAGEIVKMCLATPPPAGKHGAPHTRPAKRLDQAKHAAAPSASGGPATADREPAGTEEKMPGNYMCSGLGCTATVSKKDGLCRTCAGLMRRKDRAEAPAKPALQTPIGPGSIAPRGGLPAGIAAPPPAADGPGPLTLAVCDFFAAAARASEKVDLRMTKERDRLSIQVDFLLPGAAPAAEA